MSESRVVESVTSIPELLEELESRRVLLVTGPNRRGVEHLQPLLAQVGLEIFDGARRHVPRATVDEALALSKQHAVDTVLSLGGGSATGLGKMLKLELGLRFIAVPTTYAGSEFTNLYGVTSGSEKVTGRDDAVIPDAVVLDVELSKSMPKAMTVTSLLNALAHPLSVLSQGEAGPDLERRAHSAANAALRALERLLRYQEDAAARSDALRAAGACAQVLMAGKSGVHHRLAHRIGGRFDVEHAALHAALLPHSVRQLRGEHPALYQRIVAALGMEDLEAELFDFLARAGAASSLRELAIPRDGLAAMLEQDAELPAPLVWAAYHGRRPTLAVRHEDLGLREPVALWGPDFAEARRVVVALHGRGSNADAMVRRVLELSGDDPGLLVIAPQAPDCSWYSKRHTEPRESLGAELQTSLQEALTVIEVVAERAPLVPIVLAGFSQGACLAFDVLASVGRPLAALIALSGSGIGGLTEAPVFGPALAKTPVLMGASIGDPWLDAEAVALTAKQLSEAGCDVTLEMVPGDVHTFHQRHRWLARSLLRGDSMPGTVGGFRSPVETEDLAGALPRGHNSPRQPAYGLYAEQVNATGFVAERSHNLRSWFYRIRPSAQQGAFSPLPHATASGEFLDRPECNLVGFAPLELPAEPADFVDGLVTLGGAGSAQHRRGYALHLYAANRNMQDRAFCNADGELLILPELGALTLQTECGVLEVAPGSIAVVPRGLRFSVQLMSESARGYVAETYGRVFELPDRGPVGANGLTESRDFRAPTAWHENRLAPGYRLTHKLGGALYEATQDYSPFDVVAWHGNFCPYAYDLGRFSPVGNTRFDHSDPSVFTVLSAPLDERGSNCLDLVAFVPRWDPTEGTFRPPYFHRNATTELNGIIKNGPAPSGRFVPGAVFLTPNLTPHSVAARVVERIRSQSDEEANAPHRSPNDSLWFQFESVLPFCLTPWAKAAASQRPEWPYTWGVHRSTFSV